MRPDERLGTVAIIASAFAYGFLAILIKLALEAGARPLPLVGWRFVIGAAAVWLLLWLRRRPAPPRQAYLALAGLGALYAINALLFTLALQWVPAATALLVFYTYPVVVVLLAALFLGERLTARHVVAMALAAAGCGLTAGVGAAGGDPRGIALVLLSMLGLSLYIVNGRRILAALPGHGSAAIILTGTAAVTLTIAAATQGLDLGGGPRAAWLLILLAIACTALPITLFVIGLKRVDAGKAAIYSTIEPIITVVAARFILDERISTLQYAGGVLILSGVAWLRLAQPLPRVQEPTPLEAP